MSTLLLVCVYTIRSGGIYRSDVFNLKSVYMVLVFSMYGSVLCGREFGRVFIRICTVSARIPNTQ